MLRRITAGVLEVAYEEAGPADGTPIILLHGFPYDVHAFGDVTPLLVGRGCRVIAPYLRGYGPTRFLSADTPRSGQQAALGHDLLALMDALSIRRAVVTGYDWGGRAACVVAALWPERVRGLVSCGGYNIQDIASSATPQPPEAEHRYWYQYYFHGERGRAGLARYRRELGKLLWRLWSPSWNFDDATFEGAAPEDGVSFGGPHGRHNVIGAMQHDGGHRDSRACGQALLGGLDGRIARDESIAMAVRMDHDVDEVRIVERARRSIVRRVIEIPARRPETPEKLAELMAISRETRPAALAVKVVLIPVPMLGVRRLWCRAARDVLNVIAAARNEASHAFGP